LLRVVDIYLKHFDSATALIFLENNGNFVGFGPAPSAGEVFAFVEDTNSGNPYLGVWHHPAMV
jgi:hypothetical protein